MGFLCVQPVGTSAGTATKTEAATSGGGVFIPHVSSATSQGNINYHTALPSPCLRTAANLQTQLCQSLPTPSPLFPSMTARRLLDPSVAQLPRSILPQLRARRLPTPPELRTGARRRRRWIALRRRRRRMTRKAQSHLPWASQ